MTTQAQLAFQEGRQMKLTWLGNKEDAFNPSTTKETRDYALNQLESIGSQIDGVLNLLEHVGTSDVLEAFKLGVEQAELEEKISAKKLS